MSSDDAGAPGDAGDAEVKVVLEQTLLTCPEVFVYRIPPMKTSGGHRAEDWNLAAPLATCSLVVMRRDNACLLHLLAERPKKDGPPGATEPHLFAKCRIELDLEAASYSRVEHWVEAVVDSSRYSVVRISDERTGREAHIGIGFRERSDAVNFKMSLQEYENALRREKKAEAMHDEYERSHPSSDGGGADGGSAGSGSGTPPGGDSLTPPSTPTLPAVSKLTLKEGEKIHVKIKGVTDKDPGDGLRKSTPLGLSGRKVPPAGAPRVGKGGLLLKKPPSDRQIATAPPEPDDGTTSSKPAPSSTTTSTTSSSGTSTPEESNESPPAAVAAAVAAVAGGEGDEGDKGSDDEFGDFEEA